MSEQWNYATGGGQVKKAPEVVLLKLLDKGIIDTSATLVWKSGMESWQSIAQVSRCQVVCAYDG